MRQPNCDRAPPWTKVLECRIVDDCAFEWPGNNRKRAQVEDACVHGWTPEQAHIDRVPHFADVAEKLLCTGLGHNITNRTVHRVEWNTHVPVTVCSKRHGEIVACLVGVSAELEDIERRYIP